MLESIKKNRVGIILMCISSFCVCIGQLLWKLSAEESLAILLAGFAFYGVGALIMILAYKFGSLSVLQPMLSMNYIFSILLATVVLKETITITKIIGVVIIMIGVAFIAGGDQ